MRMNSHFLLSTHRAEAWLRDQVLGLYFAELPCSWAPRREIRENTLTHVTVGSSSFLQINSSVNKIQRLKANTKVGYLTLSWDTLINFTSLQCVSLISILILSCFLHSYPHITHTVMISFRLDHCVLCRAETKGNSSRSLIYSFISIYSWG